MTASSLTKEPAPDGRRVPRTRITASRRRTGFSAGIVQDLNKRALAGKIENLVIVAAPRALGEMRKHYHKALSAVLLAEVAKDLTGHPVADVEKALAGA